MKAEIRKIGNSRGIILPKAILEQCHFEDDVEMEVSNDALIIRAFARSREGWKEAFKRVGQEDKDTSIREWQNVTNDSDEDLEW